MKIQFLNGGLANQVFQYIFYRYAQIKVPDEEWYLDDSFFFTTRIHNGYELERVFGLHPNLLSGYFEPDVWDYMIALKKEQNKSIPQILLDNGTDIVMLTENKNWQEWNPFDGERIEATRYYDYQMFFIPGTVYYHGYWIRPEWFGFVEDTLRKELVFPEITETWNLQYMEEIENSESCSIHIRRGDYVSIGIDVEDAVYKEAIKAMMGTESEITLFVFSDDMDYCRGHAHDMGLDLPVKTVYVEGNGGETAYRDMQLMSHCKYMINGNSAFCYLAALLNQDRKFMIAPPNRNLQ